MNNLPIKVLSRDAVEIDGRLLRRPALEMLSREDISLISRIGAQTVLRMMDEFEEPKPTWESGTVMRFTGNCQGLVRLDNFLHLEEGLEVWDALDMIGGIHRHQHIGDAWEVHRLPHEFNVGDWAEWIDHSSGPFQVNNLQNIDGRTMLYGLAAFLPAEECRHVPPPKDSPSGNKTSEMSDPFQGPNWFSEANRKRCEATNGFNHKLSSWTTSDWITAVIGELGEAANNAKKLNRIRDGIPGNKEQAQELRDKLRKELGDTYVYLDLLCQSLGFYALDSALEVFDGKSREIGYPRDLRDELRRVREELK